MKCSINECDREATTRKGWCRKHYDRWHRHGDPSMVKKRLSERGAPLAWIKENMSYESDDCLIWPFARSPDGRAHINPGKPTRIMCELVYGLPPSDIHEAAHSCGNANGGCISPKHLRWATPIENAADKLIHGTLVRGSDHYASKLTENDVRRIRSLAGRMMQKDIAAIYGVNISCISKVVNRVHWRHV